jgi:hypothetical protein
MRITRHPVRWLVVLAVMALLLVGCGADEAVSTTSTAPVTEPTTVSTATTVPETTLSTSTTQPETTTTSEGSTTTTPTTATTVPTTTSTTAAPGTTVEAVVAWMEAWLADQFERSDPPEGVVGPSQIDCDDSGPVPVGGVLACRLDSQTEPGFELDAAGAVIYVLDPSGRAVWEVGTDLPSTTGGLEEVYALASHGLMCKDLMAEEYAGETYHFSGVGRPEESAFFWSLVYWSFEGEPDRMDADGDGIPCETLHPADMVTAVLEGGPVPLYLR